MAERRFSLRGEVDIARVPNLRAALDGSTAFSDADLVIDCSELTFIDSSGVGLLLGTVEQLDRQGRSLRVANLGPFGVRIMEIMGVTDALRVNQPPLSSIDEHDGERYG